MARNPLGAFASNNPRAVTLGGFVSFRAGVNGLLAGRFGWGDPNTGLANNIRSNPEELLGFVSTAHFGTRLVRRTPPGYQVTMCAGGDFFARFPSGASPGQPVYARLVDGSPVSGETDDAELTPWFVVTPAGPGGTSVISTWSKIT